MDKKTISLAVIGGGVVGRCYSDAFAANGIQVCGIWDANPSPELEGFAAARAIPVHTMGGAWLAQADMVVSAVFGTAALEVANSAFTYLRPDTLFIDVTTADPDDMIKADAVSQRLGIAFVDVAITGAINVHGSRTPLLIAGLKANAAAELFGPFGGPIQVVGSRPGDAASLKLLRSIFTKGLEALAVECMVTAEQRGLRQQLHDILRDIDRAPLQETMESMVRTHIAHAARRAKEVAQAQGQMLSVGLQPVVLPAVEALFARTTQWQDGHPPSGPELAETLRWLGESAAINVKDITAT